MGLEGKRVFVLGGTSGIGLAVAEAALERGAEVTVGSRSPEKRGQAESTLGNRARVIAVDVTNDESVAAAFQELGPLDHVVHSAPGAAVGKVADVTTEAGQAGFNAKFWGAYRTAKYAEFRDGGSLVLLSGQMARRPRAGLVLGGAVNAAVEALARGLAAELAPVRVVAISPGLIDTPLHARLSAEQRAAQYKAAAEKLPVRRVGTPEDVATMIVEVMQNGFVTGVAIEIDGGSLLGQ